MAHVHEAPTLTPASDMNSLDQASSGEALLSNTESKQIEIFEQILAADLLLQSQ